MPTGLPAVGGLNTTAAICLGAVVANFESPQLVEASTSSATKIRRAIVSFSGEEPNRMRFAEEDH
jgi:hypothetical protein